MTSLIPSVLVALLVPAVLGLGTPETCANPQLSCQNNTVVTDLCCFNAPGGQLLQTQFWDTSPSTGPSNSWTIHGLWPDHCDGTFDEDCDSSRAYTGIGSILQSFGKTALLADMNTYWKDIDGDDESFWEHEWATHGTCISTLKPSCYSGYTSKQEVPDFFQKTVDLFKTLDSFTALSNAGITPSSTKTYTSAQILAALKASHGFNVAIQCSSGALDEIWYAFDVRGSVQTGTFVGANINGASSSCSSTGIKYLPKSGSPVTTTGTSPTSTPTGTPGGFSGSGFLNAITGGSQDGCLISAGVWFTTGTCATYTATASGSGFTLKSSKGNCGISGSTFTCASGVTSTVFSSSDGLLSFNGKTTFFAAEIPTGQTQVPVTTTSGKVSVSFEWENV